MNKKQQQPTGMGGGPARAKSAKQYSTGGQLSRVSKSATGSHSKGKMNGPK